MCNGCGKVASDKWVEKQKVMLPKTQFQHITFTMPSEIWPFFDVNRHLLSQLPTLANKIILKLAKKKKAIPGIFTALHTFGRKLNWNTHVHLSVTKGGITKEEKWVSLYFKVELIESMWRYMVIDLLRDAAKSGQLVIPEAFDCQWFHHFLNKQYSRKWHIHCAQPTKSAEKDIGYLGRYLKRPPLSNARLIHYSGSEVFFTYHDHNDNTEKELKLSTFEFLSRFTKHIPEKHARMIRYAGFLANRCRGKLIPVVKRLVGDHSDTPPKHVSWRTLYKKTFNANPLKCILCDSMLKLSHLTFGLTNAEMLRNHDKLALLKIIRI